jgi:hypothetical protein
MESNNIISRETFIESIDAIRNQIERDMLVSEHLGKAFPSAHAANLIPDNSLLSDALINVLSEAMGDKSGWIEWFCYETDFGEESHRLRAWNPDGSVIKMDDAGDLYDMLTRE